ncbi:MAG: benzoyl-CoA oxygenase subunit B [Candidatus Tectimicrobiota bacterium]|nr:MAG: benzoyl-CoA oxygenase subunit B [Candidatus Tectomicrobia bacterium]
MPAKFRTFDEWVDLFYAWQDDIGLERSYFQDYRFEVKYGELPTQEILFGDFAGERRWESVREIPDQRIRDALLNYLVYQGDTEFASVEQQRTLFATAPSDYDLRALCRVMAEEMRHGFQMSHLLVEYFGTSGRLEAQKLLERRAFRKQRLLGSFNEEVDNWLDFFVYTQFIDRDGKYQLRMLSHSAFAPLARSTLPMLKEESFHLGTGNDGLRRIVRAGKIPIPLLQKYFNKWVPTAYDLFGTDESSSAHWGYVWGLKGRFDEDTNPTPADREHLNEYARSLFIAEIRDLTERLNRLIPEDQPKLVLPDEKFHRRIGRYAGGTYSVSGERLSPEAYAQHLAEVLPSEADKALVAELTRQPDWIAPKN